MENKTIDCMKILLIAGCNIEYTPVVNSYLKYLQVTNQQVEVVEFIASRRVDFIWRSIIFLFKRKYDKFVFVNFQSLPVLFIASLLGIKNLIYWKLESHQPFENWSLVLKFQLLEWVINRKSVNLMVPTLQRVKIQNPVFLNTFVLPNAPLLPYVNFQANDTPIPEVIKLIIYGNASAASDIYLNDWASLVTSQHRLALTVIGQHGIPQSNVRFLDRLPHADLVKMLLSNKFQYSIVGYKNRNFNTLFAAPNKLIESLSCGIPVIGNINNPYIAEIVNTHKCGILMDFDCLDLNALLDQAIDYKLHSSNALIAANELCLMNQVAKTPLGID